MHQFPFLPFGAALLGLCGSFPAVAQAPAPADTARPYTHHLGLTASPVLDGFFRNNRSLPVGVLYKRQTTPGRLLRLGVQLTQSSSNRLGGATPPTPASVENILAFNVAVNVGREYARPLSRRWTVTAGADLVAGYGYARVYTEGASNSGTSGEPARRERTDTDRTYRLAVAPFVGVRYSLHNRLYATAEATVSVAYQRITYKIEGSTIGLVTGDRTDAIGGDTRYNLVNVAFRPVSQLALHYLL